MRRSTGHPAELEATEGFRIWRVVSGQLRSHRNGTVWPTGHALIARAQLGTPYWKQRIRSLVSMLVLSLVAVTVGCLGLVIMYDVAVAVAQMDFPQLLPRKTTIVTIGAVILVIHVVIHIQRSALFPVLKARAVGMAVAPGSNTPGIFAMRLLADVQDWDSLSKPGQVLVRGTVWLWGDTIEHEYGVKGEYAYPGVIMDVHCAGCHGWVPIEEYGDESEPPLDARCKDVGFQVEGWEAAGLSRLRTAAPQWFEDAA